jgi:hypothetical protein
MAMAPSYSRVELATKYVIYESVSQEGLAKPWQTTRGRLTPRVKVSAWIPGPYDQVRGMTMGREIGFGTRRLQAVGADDLYPIAFPE